MYIKNILCGFLLMVATSDINAQINLQASAPMNGLVQRNQLWNTVATNSSNTTLHCKLQLIVKDRNTGSEVLSAISSEFILNKGAKQLNSSLVSPITYHYINPSTIRSGDLLSVGNYTACLTLVTSDEHMAELAEDCMPFDAEPLSPPMLNIPEDSTVLYGEQCVFTWIAPSPMQLFDVLEYGISISEINDGQLPSEAIQMNVPIFSQSRISQSQFAYSGLNTKLKPGKWYAWQVTANDRGAYAAKSEVFVFRIEKERESDRIIRGTPFVKMRMDEPEVAIAPNGILKLSYLNRNSDSTARIVIRNLSGSPDASGKSNKKLPLFEVKLTPGDNYIQLDLKKAINYVEGETYQAELINDAKEKWMLLFKVKKLKDQ